MMTVTSGRIVSYRLSTEDAVRIRERRMKTDPLGMDTNQVQPGDVYPALVVRVFEGAQTLVNLKVQLDGYDMYWATSRAEGPADTPIEGRWFWPDRS